MTSGITVISQSGAGGGREALGLLRRGQRLAGISVITASASRRRRGPWLTNSRIDERSNPHEPGSDLAGHGRCGHVAVQSYAVPVVRLLAQSRCFRARVPAGQGLDAQAVSGDWRGSWEVSGYSQCCRFGACKCGSNMACFKYQHAGWQGGSREKVRKGRTDAGQRPRTGSEAHGFTAVCRFAAAASAPGTNE